MELVLGTRHEALDPSDAVVDYLGEVLPEGATLMYVNVGASGSWNPGDDLAASVDADYEEPGGTVTHLTLLGVAAASP